MKEVRHWQIRSLLRGYYNRHHHVFEAVRIPAFITAKLGGHKASTIQDFMCFSWEQAERDARIKREMEEGIALLEQMKEEEANNSKPAT